MKTVSQALRDFIEILKTGGHGIPAHNAPELLDRWSIEMETQLNVLASKGAPVEGKQSTFDDGDVRFWNIRVPKGANTPNPEFNDYPLKFPPVLYASALGCTGWNWKNKTSHWVGFDFDAITGHAAGVGVTQDELKRVQDAACGLPWVETRRSTGGQGIHLYVLIDGVPTETHTEHAALARCILGLMSRETGFDFASRLDTCGSNMWIWHRKMCPENRGLELIKSHEVPIVESDLPVNWHDHIEVVKRSRSKVSVAGIEDESSFDKLAAAQQRVTLTDAHKNVIAMLRNRPYGCEWVSDHNCARIHTKALEDLTTEGLVQGVFQTTSRGNDPNTPNAFMFPLSDGSWVVYRFSQGVAEAPTWRQDGEGWTTCYFNRKPDLRTAARACGGKLNSKKGGYNFDRAGDARETLKLLGSDCPLPPDLHDTPAFIRIEKDGHISISLSRDKSYSGDMSEWIEDKSQWLYTTETTANEDPGSDIEIDALARQVQLPNRQQVGWLIRCADGDWGWTNKDDVKSGLIRMGVKKGDLDFVLGEAIFNRWTLVHLPFQPTYPGSRQINFGAPQYVYTPSDTDEPKHPTWDLVMQHCFRDLDASLRANAWAQENNVVTGADYGRLWTACLLREPFQHLPYLFLFGEQNSGKSILHESISLLMTSGVVSADRALRSNNDFNGELANAVLAYIEETDLSSARVMAYNRLKAWVTSPMISIRKMRTDSYEQANCLHFIQCANKRDACPIFAGDTRITMMYVPAPQKEIPKGILINQLKEEAPDFMKTLLEMPLPSVEGRLRIPVIETASKRRAESDALTELEEFIEEHCVAAQGSHVPYGEMYDRFMAWVSNPSEWSKKRFTRQLPDRFPRVRLGGRTLVVQNLEWRSTE
jgi:hypothetical protein